MEAKTNGTVNGTTENGDDNGEAGNWKKQRETRLLKAKTLVPIKIEDESDEELNTKNTRAAFERADKAVQTDNIALMDTLRKMVQERMRQYQTAAVSDKSILDKALSPKLEKLEKENEELRKYALALMCQLDLRGKEKEKQSLKRPFEDTETLLKAVSSTSPVTRPPPYTVAIANANPLVTNNGGGATRMLMPRQIRPPPQLMPTNPSLSQPRPEGVVLNPPRAAPVQVANNNVRQISPAQPIMRHPFIRNERFMLANNNIPMSGVNTHLVSSNPGLRMMTSMPPDVLIRPAMDPRSHVFNTAPNLGANGQMYNQFMSRMPTNVANPQLRPVQNAVRPFSQPAPPHNVPTATTTFSPLPKLTANISTSNNAIVLTWDYDASSSENKEQYKVECYQLFAHQAKDARVAPPSDTKQWKKIGVVNALPLPMACTLTQFASGSIYFFAVVAVDVNGREGEISNPCVIRLDVNR